MFADGAFQDTMTLDSGKSADFAKYREHLSAYWIVADDDEVPRLRLWHSNLGNQHTCGVR